MLQVRSNGREWVERAHMRLKWLNTLATIEVRIAAGAICRTWLA